MAVRRGVNQHRFSEIPNVDIQRSSFDRTHTHKTTFDSGYLVPIYVDEVLPGDTFDLKAAFFARMSTPIVPIMDNLRLKTYFFFVPNRLLWKNWQKFCGEQESPGDSTDFVVPTVSAPAGGFSSGSIFDYFGIPTRVPNITVSALYSRAYNLIYNEWFRDQNLIDSVPVPTDDGPDNPADFPLLRRNKTHDYFTSALPWPQKGPGVEISLGGTATVNPTDPKASPTFFTGVGDSFSFPIEMIPQYTAGNTGFNRAFFGGRYQNFPGTSWQSAGGTADADSSNLLSLGNNPTIGSVRWDNPNLQADLSGVHAFTINSVRQAFQIQRMLERDARGGSRYTEILRSHFRVVSPDARLQRPEYLGGATSRVDINPVQQTSSSDSTSPQGNLAAFGVIGDTINGFSKSFVEHGVIIGLVSVTADLTYQQGIPRIFSRKTRYDYYWPTLAHLGEQAIYNKEIYAQGNADDDKVFGYQERYAEYRYYPSKITGKFRSTDPQSLDVWHLSQKFDSLPTLSAAFIRDTPPVKRALAVQTEPEFIMDSHFSLRCTRPMPLYGVPGLIDHF